MTILFSMAMLAQTQTETGATNQTSWGGIYVGLVVVAFVLVALFIRRARRAHGDPPAGSVPASEVPGHLNSGRMSDPSDSS